MTPLGVLGVLFPATAARWLVNRGRLAQAQRFYEGVANSQYRPQLGNRTSADGVMNIAGSKLREYARHLEENHDLIVGIFDDLVNNSIGEGARVQPMVRLKGGSDGTSGALAEDFNDRLAELWMRWGQEPETTGELAFPAVERLVARSMFRDGEIFVQKVIDNRYPHKIPDLRLSLELLEADFCPFDYQVTEKNILHGIENNSWNRAVAFYLWKNHPGDPINQMAMPRAEDLKRVPAGDMLHVKFSRRLRQRRGVPIIHAIINRMRDLKDYEESERIAAKVAADLTGFIKRNGENYTGLDVNAQGNREYAMSAGQIHILQPGEDVGTIKSDRPNTGLEKFRNAMLRAVAAGTGTRYSSISRDYNGTYSAQRQELVEGAIAYRANFAYLVSRFHRPVYNEFIQQALLSKALGKLPMGIDMTTINRADFRAPALPWIDPSSEAKAYQTLIESGLESRTEIMRQRGRDPTKVWEEIQEEQASGLFASAIKAAAPGTPDQSSSDVKPDETDEAAAA
jgi:lambda family phage portal protein